MARQVHPPRGMRDFLPADKARREHALSAIKRVYRSHGFDEIETPVLEDYGRLHSGLGGDNEKLSFSVLKRGITPDALAAAAENENAEQLADLGLRFDLTVPLARYYATHRAELPPVFRSIQVAPVWRAERPQKGRYRQFVQADIDIIGEPGVLAEVELVAATSEALAALGLVGCSIRLNDRRILFGLLGHAGLEPEQHDRALIIVDKLDKIGVGGVVAELRAVDAAAADRMGEVLETVEPLLSGEGIALTEQSIRAALPDADADSRLGAGVLNLVALGEALEHVIPEGVTLKFDPTLVRGMGYYTGTIFEIEHPSSGSSVGGGGRYDGMIGRFLGQDVPAVGFSIGFERVVDLIDLPAIAGPEAIALIADSDASAADLARLKQELVRGGHRVRIERRQKNMKSLLARVAAEGFTQTANVRAGQRDATRLEFTDLRSEVRHGVSR